MSIDVPVSGMYSGFDPQSQLRKCCSKVSVKMLLGNFSVLLLLKSVITKLLPGRC